MLSQPKTDHGRLASWGPLASGGNCPDPTLNFESWSICLCIMQVGEGGQETCWEPLPASIVRTCSSHRDFVCLCMLNVSEQIQFP